MPALFMSARQQEGEKAGRICWFEHQIETLSASKAARSLRQAFGSDAAERGVARTADAAADADAAFACCAAHAAFAASACAALTGFARGARHTGTASAAAARVASAAGGSAATSAAARGDRRRVFAAFAAIGSGRSFEHARAAAAGLVGRAIAVAQAAVPTTSQGRAERHRYRQKQDRPALHSPTLTPAESSPQISTLSPGVSLPSGKA
jgi:hypothetical protein